jgi:hypothetical protein
MGDDWLPLAKSFQSHARFEVGARALFLLSSLGTRVPHLVLFVRQALEPQTPYSKRATFASSG